MTCEQAQVVTGNRAESTTASATTNERVNEASDDKSERKHDKAGQTTEATKRQSGK